MILYKLTDSNGVGYLIVARTMQQALSVLRAEFNIREVMPLNEQVAGHNYAVRIELWDACKYQHETEPKFIGKL